LQQSLKAFDRLVTIALHFYMVKTRISSKGQTTIPSQFRKQWKTSQVFWEVGPKGTAVVRPVPDAMSLFGIAGNNQPRDPREMEKAQEAIAGDANEGSAK
jgi:bifunctional DNA-binding transcriptional regulator/antitoxin component of YhaV-PrlF toxin-antitoxin module